jgi:hypothetical protein
MGRLIEDDWYREVWETILYYGSVGGGSDEGQRKYRKSLVSLITGGKLRPKIRLFPVRPPMFKRI